MKSLYFTEEHELFRNSVRQFIETDVIPYAEKWEDEKRIPDEIWKKMGDSGFLGINYPEQYGGVDTDFFYSVVFLEEIARSGLGGFTAAVSVHQYMATAHIFKAGSEFIKEKYLASAISGDKIGALAITEPDSGSDVYSIKTKAEKIDDYYIVNGSKTFITNGVFGGFITTAVKTGKGISLLVIDSDSEGLTKNQLKKMGWYCSDTAELFFNDVKVPIANLIGEEDKGFYYLMESFQLERLVAAILAVSSAQYCLDITLKYINERTAFGSPIAKLQTIRHTIALLSSELEAARQLVYNTSWLYSQGIADVEKCSMSKLIATELYKKIADSCLQFFGGYGYMEEYLISRIYRDARVNTIVGGTSEIMKEIIAKIIIDKTSYKSAYKE